MIVVLFFCFTLFFLHFLNTIVPPYLLHFSVDTTLPIRAFTSFHSYCCVTCTIAVEPDIRHHRPLALQRPEYECLMSHALHSLVTLHLSGFRPTLPAMLAKKHEVLKNIGYSTKQRLI